MIETREKVNQLLAEQRVAQKALASFNSKLEAELVTIEEIEEVQKLFQSAISIMYSSLSSKLGDIVSEGLSLVFPDSQYKFVVEFNERRGNVEADLFLEDSLGNRYDPLTGVGGGVADFVSLLLRITYIILSKYDNILISDESLKFIDRKRIADAASFTRKVCEDFKFQLVMISHIPELIDEAEVVYNITKNKGISSAKKV